MKKFSFVSIVMIASFLLAACGTSATPAASADVSVRLKWLHQVQFAGMYVAEHEGYYADENLKVTLDPVDFEQQISIDKVVSGENDFGIAAPEEILIARQEGKPVRALAVIFRINPAILLVTPESGIKTPQDFVGQKVAISPGAGEVIYKAMMENLGLDRGQVQEIPVTTYDLWECWDSAPVCPNYATNGPILLDTQGEDYVEIWPSDYGISWYGDVLFTTDQMIAEQPDVVARFVRATLRGWQQAIEDTDLAVTATLVYDNQLDKDFQTRAMRASIPLIDTGDAAIGVMDDAVWQSIQQILIDQEYLDKPLDLKAVYTNEFVTP